MSAIAIPVRTGLALACLTALLGAGSLLLPSARGAFAGRPGLIAFDSSAQSGGGESESDCVGSDDTLALAAGAVAPGGHVSLLGLAGGTFPMRFGAVPLETSVIFSNWGTRAELAEVVALARDGAIDLEIERVALADVPAAYERLAAGGGHGRLVAVPEPA